MAAAWVPPPGSALHISNCSTAANWFASALNAAQDGTLRWDVPSGLTIRYLVSLIPDNYTKPNASDVISWYYTMDTSLLSGITNMAYDDCGRQICNYLDWEGDSDISGVGMIISYFLAAGLTTLYFLIMGFAHLRSHRLRVQPGLGSSKLDNWFVGFAKTAETFLDAALIFAVSMLVAATSRYATVVKRPDDHYSVYQLVSSVVMSTFAIFPALALQSVSRDLPRHWVRLVLWLVVIAFSITIEVLYNIVYKARKWNQDSTSNSNDDAVLKELVELVWIDKCDNYPFRKQLEHTVTAGHVVMCLNLLWWIYYVVSSLVSPAWKDRHLNDSRFVKRWRSTYRYLRLLNGLVALAFTWVFLAMFVKYRSTVARKAGDYYEDSNWTFGQVLALATWAPVLVELVTKPWGFEGEDKRASEASEEKSVKELQHSDGTASP